MKKESSTTYRRALSFFLATCVLIHVLLGVYLTFSNARYIGNWGPFKIYQLFLHTGPFFSENTIKSTTHLQVSYLTDKSWKDLHVVERHLRNYQENLLRFDELLVRDYVRHNATLTFRTEQKLQSEAFRKLNRYIVEHYELQNADSIRCTYQLSEFNPQNQKSQIYTLFHLQYKPSDIK